MGTAQKRAHLHRYKGICKRQYLHQRRAQIRHLRAMRAGLERILAVFRVVCVSGLPK